MIKKIYKKDIPSLINTPSFWEHDFLIITQHRLFAHYNNPNCDDDDIVLLLAYKDNELVGYMGVFTDFITINNTSEKIGWLSTWWIHPKTKGTGIGRLLLSTMYESWNGKIGVSQFTPSASRVYNKSNYFTPLKNDLGYKYVLRSNISNVLSKKYGNSSMFKLVDGSINLLINLKLSCQKHIIKSKVKNIRLDYVNVIDSSLEQFIKSHNKNHLSQKSADFFKFLKTYHWVQETPLEKLYETNRYRFSSGVKYFNIYLIKVYRENSLIGFMVLQRKNDILKVLFTYNSSDNAHIMASVISLHAINLKIKEFLCFDSHINENLIKLHSHLYKRKKVKASIISKAFNEVNFDNYIFNYGDGDCSFA